MVSKIISLLLIFVVFVTACSVIKSPAETEATNTVEQWLTSNQLPSKNIQVKTLMNDGSYADIAVYAATRVRGHTGWDPRETVVKLRNLNGTWTAQPIQAFESPFTATIMSTTASESNKCTDTDLSVKPQSGYPCLRVQNNGNFDWNWATIHWRSFEDPNSGSQNGGWGGSFAKNISLKSRDSVDVSAGVGSDWRSWGLGFAQPNIAIDDNGGGDATQIVGLWLPF